MHRLKKLFWLAVGLFALSVLTAGTVLAATGGFASVRVHEEGPDGTSLFIPVPAGLVDLALYTGVHFVPERELARIREDLGEWGPALKASARELADAPDAVLVSVVDGSERVLVEKRGRRLLISVDSPGETVRVSVPASLLPRALAALGV